MTNSLRCREANFLISALRPQAHSRLFPYTINVLLYYFVLLSLSNKSSQLYSFRVYISPLFLFCVIRFCTYLNIWILVPFCVLTSHFVKLFICTWSLLIGILCAMKSFFHMVNLKTFLLKVHLTCNTTQHCIVLLA